MSWIAGWNKRVKFTIPKENVPKALVRGTTVTSQSFTIGTEHPTNFGRAFDGVIDGAGASTDSWYSYYSAAWKPDGWVGQDFGSGNEKVIKGISFYMAQISYAPRDFTFEASNTGAWAGEQVTLLTESFYYNMNDLNWHTFAFDNDTSYRYYRFNVQNNHGDVEYLVIRELEMYEESPEEETVLREFPLLINLEAAQSFIFSELDVNNEKLAVYSGDTECPVEVAYWDHIAQKANLWARVPIVRSTEDLDFYIYYDNTHENNPNVGLTNTKTGRRVWNNGYVGVWHLNEDPSGGAGCIKNSVSDSMHGTPIGMDAANSVPGVTGKCLDFNGASERVSITGMQTALPAGSSYTLEVMADKDGPGTDNEDTIMSCEGGFIIGFHSHSTPDEGIRTYIWNGSWISVVAKDKYTSVWTSSQSWLDYAAIHDGSSLRYIINDDVAAHEAVGALSWSGTKIMYLAGRDLTGGPDYFDGRIDEARVSDISRSDAWVLTTRISNRDLLFTKGPEELRSSQDEFPHRYSFKITVPDSLIENDLEDYPVRIRLSDKCSLSDFDAGNFFTELQGAQNYKKFVVTVDKKTECFVEIEDLNFAEKEATLWVKIPNIYDTVDTVIYLMYDKTAPVSERVGYIGSSDGQQVWSSNFVFVGHTSSVSNFMDSSPYQTAVNVIAGLSDASVVEKGGGSKAFNFTAGDYISLEYPNPVQMKIQDALTLEAFIEYSSQPDNAIWCIIGSQIDPGNNGTSIHLDGRLQQGERQGVHFQLGNGATWYGVDSPNPVVANTWSHIAAGRTAPGTAVDFYINGVYGTDTSPSSWNGVIAYHSSYSMYIGRQGDYEDRYFTGDIGEVRWSNIERSYGWNKATYLTVIDQLTSIEHEQNHWLGNWANRTKITFSNTLIDETLVRYPLLLRFDDGDDIYDYISETPIVSKKVAVTMADGITEFPVEVEAFYSTDDYCNYWTRLPLYHAGKNTELYFYMDRAMPDNPMVGVAGEAAIEPIWQDYNWVYHMSQPAIDASTYLDSATTNDGVILNHEVGDLVDGLTAKAWQYDVDVDAIELNYNFTNKYFCCAFYKHEGLTNWPQAMGREEYISFYPGNCTDQAMCLFTGNGSWDSFGYSDTVPVINQWNYHGWSMNAGSIKYYLNGSPDGTFSTTNRNINVQVHVGRRNDGPNYNYNLGGKLQEIRVATETPSESVIKADNANFRDQLVLTVGSRETGGGYIYYYDGYITVNAAQKVQRVVRLYNRETGDLIDADQSSVDTGYYYLTTAVSGTHYVVALDDDGGETYNALIADRLLPRGTV
jgi:hypothetical protein